MDTTGEGGGERERRFSVNICTRPSHVQDNNLVNNLNETLYNVNSLDEPLNNVNSLNETLLNESKLHHGLKCMYTNARSIMNKLTSLESNVAEYNPDVIGITESWATEKGIQLLLELEDYTCYRQDRMSDYSTKGGGLLMYMKDTFDHRLLENITVNRGIEALWCEIIIDDKKNDKVIIRLCYDSPSNDEEKSNMLYGDIYKAAGMNDCIIMGDFNRRGIDWETFVTDGHGEKLLDLSQNLFLTQHVLEKTRKESTLDLVFSSEPGMVDDLEVREEFGEGNEHQSDHRVILFQMNLKPVTILDNKESYNYNKADFSAMIIFIRSVNWRDGLYGENVERSWHMITNIVD